MDTQTVLLFKAMEIVYIQSCINYVYCLEILSFFFFKATQLSTCNYILLATGIAYVLYAYTVCSNFNPNVVDLFFILV